MQTKRRILYKLNMNKTWHRKFMESWLALTREGTPAWSRRQSLDPHIKIV
jgi:hypothetical protein